MSSTGSPAGSVRRHGRNISHPLQRRSTRGPLDSVDDPLSDAPQSPSVATPSDVASPRESTELRSAAPHEPERRVPALNLSFLQDSSIYHQLSAEDVPAAFLESENQPAPGTALADLIQHGHYRRAAEAALDVLFRCSADDANAIFELLYTRFACLVLISRPDLASHEAAILIDFLARNPPGAEEVVPLIPWALRLLLVRLQSMTTTDDGRRGLMSLYALSAEVRKHISDAKPLGNDTELATWSERLCDLGLRVADSLVEMGELETATRHLDSLVDGDSEELNYRKALLRLRIGDVLGAQRFHDKMTSVTRKQSLAHLISAATSGDFSAAVTNWSQEVGDDPQDALAASNLAVSLLYTGKISHAQQTIESLTQRLPAFPGLLFNAGTIYELVTAQVVERKSELVQSMAAKKPGPESGGWERATFEFKL